MCCEEEQDKRKAGGYDEGILILKGASVTQDLNIQCLLFRSLASFTFYLLFSYTNNTRPVGSIKCLCK